MRSSSGRNSGNNGGSRGGQSGGRGGSSGGGGRGGSGGGYRGAGGGGSGRDDQKRASNPRRPRPEERSYDVGGPSEGPKKGRGTAARSLHRSNGLLLAEGMESA
ncbi:MAG TPA: hypothetical protein VIU94_17810, partial [Streptomyces sp.]